MPPHWESSRKPLFIKTIWKDGQHHVVLNKKEEVVEIRKKGSARLSQKTTRVVKSAITTTCSNFNISPVRLYGCTSESVVNTRPELRRCNTSVKFTENLQSDCLEVENPHSDCLVAENPIRYIAPEERHIDEVRRTNKPLCLAIKSNSIDLSEPRELVTDHYNRIDKMFSFLTSTNCLDVSKDSLSERVLVWLDLAKQSGNYNNDIKLELMEPAGRKVQTAVNRKITQISDHASEPIFHVTKVCRPVQTSQLPISKNDKNLGEETDETGESSRITEKPFISSAVEENLVVANIKQDNFQKIGLKRQLHVFMPSLKKAMSDCDSSILSSNLSSYSVQKSVTL